MATKRPFLSLWKASAPSIEMFALTFFFQGPKVKQFMDIFSIPEMTLLAVANDYFITNDIEYDPVHLFKDVSVSEPPNLTVTNVTPCFSGCVPEVFFFVAGCSGICWAQSSYTCTLVGRTKTICPFWGKKVCRLSIKHYVLLKQFLMKFFMS